MTVAANTVLQEHAAIEQEQQDWMMRAHQGVPTMVTRDPDQAMPPGVVKAKEALRG